MKWMFYVEGRQRTISDPNQDRGPPRLIIISNYYYYYSACSIDGIVPHTTNILFSVKMYWAGTSGAANQKRGTMTTANQKE